MIDVLASSFFVQLLKVVPYKSSDGSEQTIPHLVPPKPEIYEKQSRQDFNRDYMLLCSR